MKRTAILAVIALTIASCCCPNQVNEEPAPTKNVILMIPDGTSTSVLALSRWYMRYMGEKDFELNVDKHVCGLMSSISSNSIMSCSAPAMGGIVTGVPQRAGHLSVYPAPDPAQDIVEVDPSKTHQPLATIMEANRVEKGRSTGVVVTVDILHATPAACASHTTSRGDRKAIARQMASNGLDVAFGGGLGYMEETTREILEYNDITLIEKDINAFRDFDGTKAWALFEDEFLPYETDRDTATIPSLAEMTAKAIEILSKNKNGFFLMVEGSKVDYAGHANAPHSMITEFLAFDEAVGVALDFAKKDGNTTVIVVPDHGNSGVTGGKPTYKNYTSKGIDSVFVGMKNYKASYYKIAELLSQSDKKDFKPIFKEWTGIDLTDKEVNDLVNTRGKIEGDYMQVANSQNFQSTISKILLSRLNISCATTTHTTEDVFLAVYHPKGHIPHGIMTNSKVNEYMCKVSGLDTTLEELSEQYYSRHDVIFDGYDPQVIKDKECPRLEVTVKGRKIVVPAWRNSVTIDGTTYKTSTPSVYIKKNNSFYVSREILDLI